MQIGRRYKVASSRSRRLPMALHYLVYVGLLHGSGRRSAARIVPGGCQCWFGGLLAAGCLGVVLGVPGASPSRYPALWLLPPAFTSSGKTPQLSSKLERSRRAALIFLLKTNFVKARVSLSPVEVILDGVGRCCCIVWPSWMRTSILPDFHASIRRCKQMRCSLAFDLLCGFCNSSMGIVIAARMARGSSADFSA